MVPFAFTTAPASTSRLSPAFNVTEPPVEKIVTPALTVRSSPEEPVSPACSMMSPDEIMSLSIVSGLDVRMPIRPRAACRPVVSLVTPPTRRPPMFHSQMSPLIERASRPPYWSPSRLRMLATMRLVSEPMLPEATR